MGTLKAFCIKFFSYLLFSSYFPGHFFSLLPFPRMQVDKLLCGDVMYNWSALGWRQRLFFCSEAGDLRAAFEAEFTFASCVGGLQWAQHTGKWEYTCVCLTPLSSDVTNKWAGLPSGTHGQFSPEPPLNYLRDNAFIEIITGFNS